MQSWHFELFGCVSASCAGQKTDDLVGKKAGALLAFLALTPGRTRPREEVIDLLWPEVDFAEARNRFRQTVFVLRKLLEPEGTASGSVIFSDRTQIGLTVEQTSDVAQFQQHLRHAATSKDSQEQLPHLRAALAVYKGELAPGFYLDALLTERERLKALAESAEARLQVLEAQQPVALPLPTPVPPISTNRFFGRTAEKAHLLQLLEKERLITLLGPGGTGKTRLVQELAGRLPHARFLSLSDLRDASGILDTMVVGLELPPSGEPALVRLKEALQEQCHLLILDNLEQLVASGAPDVLASLLNALPKLQLLVTSRIKLELPQEIVCPLAPLPDDDALALFVDRAQHARSHFALTTENHATITTLCRRLDGLPLALELAAARAAILTPQQILERLSRRFDLLADKRRDRAERHTSLRAALDWGWSLLAPDVQHFFCQLSVFRGGFSLEAAETVTGEPLAIDYLQALADSSFLVIEGERFRLLETLREYGAEKLLPDERSALNNAHFEYFLTCTRLWSGRLTGTTFEETMRSYRRDYDNCLAALDQMIPTAPLRTQPLAYALSSFWIYAHLFHTYIAYYTQLVALLAHDHSLSYEARANLYSCLAEGHHYAHHIDKALVFYEQSHALYQQALQEKEEAGADSTELTPLRRKIAGLLHNLGDLHNGAGRLALAESLLLEAAHFNRTNGNLTWLGNNLLSLSYIRLVNAFTTHDVEERNTLLEKALEETREGAAAYRHVGQAFYLSRLLANQTICLLALGQESLAVQMLEETLQLSCRLESWHAFTEALLIVHYLALERRLYEVAVPLLGACYALNERWELHMDENSPSLLSSQDTLRHSLPALLGQERYDALYQTGATASVETLLQLSQSVLSLCAEK